MKYLLHETYCYFKKEGLLNTIKRIFVQLWNEIYLFTEVLKFLFFYCVSLPRLEIRPHSVLMIELNNSHGEILPDYAHRLLELGYNVDIVMEPSVRDMMPLCRFEDERIRRYTVPIKCQNIFFALKKKLRKYTKILITSCTLYVKKSGREEFVSIFDRYPVLREYIERLVVVEHHFDRVDCELLRKDKVITLADFNAASELPTGVNPHFFGQIKITPKNEGNITNFIVVGALQNFRRNYDLLLEAVSELCTKARGKFRITVLGRKKLRGVSSDIQSCFDIKGRVAFPILYENMEAADFFLTLLDPLNPDHDRYLTAGVSGSFQLIYGFAKPCLIHEKFASMYAFNEQNSLVYAKNTDLAETMLRAVSMTGEEYLTMQSALKTTANEIDTRSSKIFQRIMQGVPYIDSF
jgi:hypothetical protein